MLYLTQADLAARWRISERTLERWRWSRQGPRFIKIGGAVRYSLQDIESYELRRGPDRSDDQDLR